MVDHDILLRRLEISFCLSGPPLHWFVPISLIALKWSFLVTVAPYVCMLSGYLSKLEFLRALCWANYYTFCFLLIFLFFLRNTLPRVISLLTMFKPSFMVLL